MTDAFEKKRKDITYTTISIGLSFLTLYGVLYLIRGEYFFGFRNLILSVFLWLSFVFCVFKLKKVKFFISLLLLIALLFYTNIFMQSYGNHSYMWLYSFPIIAFFLSGTRKGLIWVSLSLLSLGIVVVLSKIQFITLPYHHSFYIVFFASYIVIAFLVFFLNRVIENADQSISEAHEKLEKTNLVLMETAEKANEANRLKSEFLAMMSHELRTPLSGIVGFSQLLKKNKNLDEEAREFADRIYSASQRFNELLSNLLELSVSHAGKEIKIDYSHFDLEGLIQEIILIFEERFKTRNNNFRYSISCEKVICSSQLRIQQILFNLIGNAAKFTQNGRIELNVSRADEKYLFAIRDTGIGIDNAKFAEIFDMFKQIENSSDKNYQGVGIGLSISKKFVEALGGEIWVESELGQGSTFFFTIRLQPEISIEN